LPTISVKRKAADAVVIRNIFPQLSAIDAPRADFQFHSESVVGFVRYFPEPRTCKM
jgi:hypothetical protein